MTIKPSKSNLFCRPEKAEDTQTASGLFIPKKSQDAPQTAEVINIGADVQGFKQKDKIVYKPYATTEIKLNNETFFLIAEEDVLGTVVE